MPDVALSTMWMHGRFSRPLDFLLAGVALGFRSFEITSVATPALYDEIHPGEFTILSLHDPAPGDMEPGDLRRNDIVFTSLDEEKRQMAVDITKRSIDIAQRYGAQAVILHMGQTEADPDLQNRLEALTIAGCGSSPQAHALRAQLADERMSHHEQHMSALMRSLDDLVPYASARSICLGLENRRHIHEVPNFEEMAQLLAHYEDSALGYWHDVGHAELQAAVGMTPHADWLRAFGPRLVGLHIHDCIGFKDHRAPGSGHVDWQGLTELVPEHGLRTAEIKAEVAEETVQASIDYLVSLGWVRAGWVRV